MGSRVKKLLNCGAKHTPVLTFANPASYLLIKHLSVCEIYSKKKKKKSYNKSI